MENNKQFSVVCLLFLVSNHPSKKIFLILGYRIDRNSIACKTAKNVPFSLVNNKRGNESWILIYLFILSTSSSLCVVPNDAGIQQKALPSSHFLYLSIKYLKSWSISNHYQLRAQKTSKFVCYSFSFTSLSLPPFFLPLHNFSIPWKTR